MNIKNENFKIESVAYSFFCMSKWRNLWDSVAEEIAEACVEKGWSRAELARKAHIGTSTLNAFLNRQNETISSERLDNIEAALGKPLLSSLFKVHPQPEIKPQFYPVLFHDRLPVVRVGMDGREEDFMDLLRGAAQDWAESPARDDRGFFVELRSRCLGYDKGDRFFFKRHIQAHNGDIVAFLIKNELGIGEYIEDGEIKRIQKIDKKLEKDFEIIGVASEIRRSLLNR